MENTDPSHDLLAEEMHPLFRFAQASRGERFGNFLIDNLFMQFALSYVTVIVIGAIGEAAAPGLMSDLVSNDWFLLTYFVYIFNYIFYYTICEKLFKGKTLGKLITGTRAIRADGEELTFKDALLRSLSRLVPFEVFSGFGDPWHDAWTRTMVVRSK